MLTLRGAAQPEGCRLAVPHGDDEGRCKGAGTKRRDRHYPKGAPSGSLQLQGSDQAASEGCFGRWCSFDRRPDRQLSWRNGNP